jgi:hypothetical protein
MATNDARLDDWIRKSIARAREVATTDGKWDQFLNGSWWAAYAISGTRIWASTQAMRNSLVCLNTPTTLRFFSDRGREVSDHDSDVMERWIPDPRGTSVFWRFSIDGLAFVTSTLYEDFDSRTKGAVIASIRADEIAKVLRHAGLVGSDGHEVRFRLGWTGLANRNLYRLNVSGTPYPFHTDNTAGEISAIASSLRPDYDIGQPVADAMRNLCSACGMESPLIAENIRSWIRVSSPGIHSGG